MRIPGRKIWRAFKELDQFSDEQCARFVRAATAFGWSAIIRGIVLLVIGAASLLGVLWLLTEFTYDWDRTFRPAWLAIPTTFATWIGGVSLSPLVVLIIRDWILRRRIRHLLRDRGVCSACRYSLLGLPVADDLRVACPECGLNTLVDPSLGELVHDEAGRAKFSPKPGGLNDRPVFWTPKRSRIARRIVIGTLATIIGGPLVLWGLYETFLQYQASAARSAPNARQNFLALLESTKPRSGDGQVWTALRQSLGAYQEAATARLERLHRVDRATIATTYFDPSWDPPRIDAQIDDDVPGTETLSDDVKVAARVGRGIIRATVGDAVDVRAILIPWATVQGPSGGWYQEPDLERPLLGADIIASPKFIEVRKFAVQTGAIMAAAARDGRWDDYAEAARQLRLVRDSIRFTPTYMYAFLESLVESVLLEQIREDLLLTPTPRLLDIANECVSEDPNIQRMFDVIEAERIGHADLVQWFFSKPERVRRERWSKAVDEFVNPPGLGWGRQKVQGRLGFFWENCRAFDDAAAETKKRLNMSARSRPPRSDSTTDLILVNRQNPSRAGENLLQLWDQQLLAYRSLRVIIEIQREFLATGKHPESLDLVRSRLSPSDLENPFLGGEIAFAVLQPGERAVQPSSAAQMQIVQRLPFVLVASRVVGTEVVPSKTGDWIPFRLVHFGYHQQPLVILNIGRAGTSHWYDQPKVPPTDESPSTPVPDNEGP